MAKQRKGIHKIRIEIFNFSESMLTFRPSDDLKIRLGNTKWYTGTTFHPSGADVEFLLFDNGDLTLAREAVTGNRILAPGIIGVFTLYKHRNRAENLLTAVRDDDWNRFVYQ